MKKFLFAAIISLFAVTAASAQDGGGWAVGPRMNIYTNTGDTVVGLGAFGRYSFDGNWRIEPSLTALLHEGCSLDISCDAQYVFHVGGGWHLYPAAGLTINDIGRWRIRRRSGSLVGHLGRTEVAADVRRRTAQSRGDQRRRLLQVLIGRLITTQKTGLHDGSPVFFVCEDRFFAPVAPRARNAVDRMGAARKSSVSGSCSRSGTCPWRGSAACS